MTNIITLTNKHKSFDFSERSSQNPKLRQYFQNDNFSYLNIPTTDFQPPTQLLQFYSRREKARNFNA